MARGPLVVVPVDHVFLPVLESQLVLGMAGERTASATAWKMSLHQITESIYYLAKVPEAGC